MSKQRQPTHMEHLMLPVEHVSIDPLRDVDYECECVRLRCTSSAGVHGRDNARYALQVRGRRRVQRGRDGKAFGATASLGLKALRKLHAATEAAINEITGRVAPRQRSANKRSR